MEEELGTEALVTYRGATVRVAVMNRVREDPKHDYFKTKRSYGDRHKEHVCLRISCTGVTYRALKHVCNFHEVDGHAPFNSVIRLHRL